MTEHPEGRHFIVKALIDGGYLAAPEPGEPEPQVEQVFSALAADDPRIVAYVETAFRREIADVEQAPKGRHNQALHDAACNLGELVEGGYLDRETVRAALTAASRANGHVAEDGLTMTENTIKSAFRRVAGKPRVIRLADRPRSDDAAYWSPADLGLRPVGPPPTPSGGSANGPVDPPDGSPPGGGGSSSPRRRYQVTNPVDAFGWLLVEMGRQGLAGLLRRGQAVVYTARLNEEGYVVPPKRDDDNGPATMQSVSPDVLIARLALNYYIYKESLQDVTDDDGTTRRIRRETQMFFPSSSVRAALAAAEEAVNLRPLRGVTHTPMVRKDGSILDQPGYDVATGFLYLPTVDVATVPEVPTRDQVDQAVALLHGMVDQFQWAGEHDEANFFGLLLTPLLRELCPPPYKLGAIMARQPGSGKSLLAEIIRVVHGGVFRSEMPHDDAELAKSITGILTCTTAPVVQFDNVGGVIRSSRLAGLLTSDVYSDRVLGSTNQIDMINDRQWLLTGNNLALGGDMIRRTLWVTIDPGQPDPHLRTGFRLPLPGWVYDHRGEIIHALLVVIRAWVVAGEPKERRSSDSYAEWSAAVRGIITYTRTLLGPSQYVIDQVKDQAPRNRRVGGGIPGDFDHSESAQQSIGTDDEGWGEFLVAVHAAFPDTTFTVRALLDRMQGKWEERPTSSGVVQRVQVPDEIARNLVEALPAELHEKYLRAHDPRVIGKSLGRWFAFRVGRWAGSYVAEKGSSTRDKVQEWRVRTIFEVTESRG